MEIQTAFAQGEMGTEPLKFSADSNHQAESGAWDLGMEGLREPCIPGIFSAAGRHARDLSTPEIQRYRPLLSWIISRDIFLLPVGGVASIVSCDIVSPSSSVPLALSITSYSSRCA